MRELLVITGSTHRQVDLLCHLATYKVLETDQAAILQNTGRQAARKRLAQLLKLGFVEATTQGYGRARGRPARIYHLTRNAMQQLQRQGLVPDVEDLAEQVSACMTNLDHQLLLNWCLINLLHIETSHPQLKIHVVTEALPLNSAREHSIQKQAAQREHITHPDSVFTITHTEQSKILLFFLEVDMGTETISSPTGSNRDFRHKVLRYKDYLDSAGYKAYQSLLPDPFRGFRLLVVTSSPKRLLSLCRLVREIEASEFVWLTDRAALFRQGIGAPIWVPGGRQDSPSQSILGPTLACNTPLSPVKP